MLDLRASLARVATDSTEPTPPHNERYGGERLSPRHPFRLWDARTTGLRVQRAARQSIHAFATCVRQHTTTSNFELQTCKQSMDALSPRALAAAQASDHASDLVPAPTAAGKCLISAICPKPHKQGTGMRYERIGAPITARAVPPHICAAPERRKRCLGAARALSGSIFLPGPRSGAKQGERSLLESRASSRGHLWACAAIGIAWSKDSRLYLVF